MKSLFLKLVSISVCFIPLALSAYTDMDDRLDTLEKEMQEISARNPQETLGASFITAQPQIRGSDWFLTFDITYWHTKMGGTEYAYSVHSVQTNATFGNISVPIDGDTKENGLGWDLGIKVGLGRKIPQHDDWEMFARYTWYETENTDSSMKAAPSALVSLTWFDDLVASRAKSHLNIYYNNVDLELARSYFNSKQLSFRPHFGLKSAWIDINHDVAFTASGLSSNLTHFEGLDYKTKERIDFWGLGPRVGIDSKWYLGYGFHIFGDVAASILYGHFKTAQKDFAPPHSNPDVLHEGKIFSMKHKFHRFVPFAQMFVGLGWESYVNDEKQHLGFKLGYEVQYYWRVNQAHQPEDVNIGATGGIPLTPVYRMQFEKQSEDIMFYGITGEFRLDF